MNTQAESRPEIKVLADYVVMTDYISEQAADSISLIYSLIAQEKSKYAVQLTDALLKQYSDDVYITTAAGFALYHSGKRQRGYELLRSNFDAHPENIHAQCYFARIALLMDNIHEAYFAFDGKMSLEKAYPEKTEFYVSELAELLFTFGMFFAKVDVPLLVYRNLVSLEQFLPKQHDYIAELYGQLQTKKVNLEELKKAYEQKMQELAAGTMDNNQETQEAAV